jgi:conjugal transfer pilus assembly protein TraD
MKTDYTVLFGLLGGMAALWLIDLWRSLSPFGSVLFLFCAFVVVLAGLLYVWEYKTPWARKRRQLCAKILAIPESLRVIGPGVQLGLERELGIPVYLPDSIRMRHIHIIGSTGSGKTESVILNFLGQDTARGLGAIILDAKGDASFLKFLNSTVPPERLAVFDLGDAESLTYNPMFNGGQLEAAQRLFSSLTWSEEYYESKAFAALQRIFERSFLTQKRNPTLAEIAQILASPESFSDGVATEEYSVKVAQGDHSALSGLRDQVSSLTSGPLKRILSPVGEGQVSLKDAATGKILYFRLQSLISPKLVSTVGRLILNDLNFMAGMAHRAGGAAKILPTYLDEFASFACPEFADLISKARSAGLALHFSHQSVGDLAEVQEGFLTRITDNSGTKIVMRINDPETAEFFAMSFGTRAYQKITQRVTNSKQVDDAEVVGEGTTRDAHQFRASPDLFKSLPTGAGAVLVSHGFDVPGGGSSVFKIQFPKLKEKHEGN